MTQCAKALDYSGIVRTSILDCLLFRIEQFMLHVTFPMSNVMPDVLASKYSIGQRHITSGIFMLHALDRLYAMFFITLLKLN